MNLYVRYFDHESLVYNIDDVATFLSTIHDIKVNNDMLSRVAEFWQSDNVYPFRLRSATATTSFSSRPTPRTWQNSSILRNSTESAGTKDA
jgi:hypothetical protein